MFLVEHVPGLVKNINTGIFSDIINVINVKLRMISLLIELYLSISLSVTDHISRSQQYQTVFIENVMFLSD